MRARFLKWAVGVLLVLAGIAALVVAAGFVSAQREREKERAKNQLPEAAYRAIMEDGGLELLSLDPAPLPEGEGFHRRRVLGKVTVGEAAERRKLAESLRRGVESWNFTWASCFNPRHGLRATVGGQAHDFVICFECGEVDYYAPGDAEGSIYGLGGGVDERPYRELLRKAGVSEAKGR